MIRCGLCSLTLSALSVDEILACSQEGGLEGVEWWGKSHVPHGDLGAAARVRQLSEAVGIEPASYGSYYRAGVSENQGLSFRSVLDTAAELGARNIRVWAGSSNHDEASPSEIRAVVDDSLRIADLAATRGIAISFEYHSGSLTNGPEHALQFAELVAHPNVFLGWQPLPARSAEENANGLAALVPHLSTIHVFHWTFRPSAEDTADGTDQPPGKEGFRRHALADGYETWANYLSPVKTTGRDHWALLESVRGDQAEQVVADAAALRRLVS